MTKIKHYRMLTTGWMLYHTIRHVPTRWWMPGGWLQWALPLMGYYAYQPTGKE